MIPLEAARTAVLAACPRLPARVQPAAASVGCVLAEPVTAAEPVPPFANSAVDGYAVRGADVATASAATPVELPVIAEVAAGHTADGPLEPGTAIRIMTGAPIPSGADAIVMVEDTERLAGGDRVRINRAVTVGDAVREAGSDIEAGQLVFETGTEIRPATVGVLASVNRRAVEVFPRPRVAVLSTGDELVDDGGPLAPGQIRESNRVMLVAAIGQAGCETIEIGTVADDEAELEAVLRRAIETADAVVTSGGVSMGDHDVVKAVLDRIADMQWMQIAIKPAKPFAFGTLVASDGRRVPVFGLPGNPVSSLVSFELLARPALRQMGGHTRLDRPTIAAVAEEPFRRRPDAKTHFVRVHAQFGADGRVYVRTSGAQGSHQLAATAAANGIAVVPDGTGVEAGETLPVVLLHLPGL
jgi:molybdenum cofactor synthesis domain-containing protein